MEDVKSNKRANSPDKITSSNSNKVIVGVRVRPLNEKELNSATYPKSAWSVSSSTISELPSDPTASSTSSTPASKAVHEYKYNVVFDESATNTAVYERLGAPIVESALMGYNTTLLAYGQTASGKTHSMLGDSSDRGLTPHSVHHVFRALKHREQQEGAEGGMGAVLVSYVEIYNDQIRDLLNPGSKKALEIRDNKRRSPDSSEVMDCVFIKGVTEVPVYTAKDALRLLRVGQLARRTSDTAMNARSSRSHTIFMLRLHKGNVLHLVDLAGSERARDTRNTGTRLKEGSHINQSLLTLGTIISKLSSNAGTHLPYRDSKLTRLLRPALGGDSKLAILCTVTPAAMYVDETVSTLKFATRASGIVNKATIKKSAAMSVNYKTKYQQVEKEVVQLRLRFNQLQKEMALLRNNHVSHAIMMNNQEQQQRSGTNSETTTTELSSAPSDTMSSWSSDEEGDTDSIHELLSPMTSHDSSTSAEKTEERSEGDGEGEGEGDQASGKNDAGKEKVESADDLKQRLAHAESENQKLRQRLLKMTVSFTMMRIQTAGLRESVRTPKRRRPTGATTDGVHERSEVVQGKLFGSSLSDDSDVDEVVVVATECDDEVEEIIVPSVVVGSGERTTTTTTTTTNANASVTNNNHVEIQNVTIIQRIMFDSSPTTAHKTAGAITSTMDPGIGGGTMLALALGNAFQPNRPAMMSPGGLAGTKMITDGSASPQRVLAGAVGNFMSMIRNIFTSVNS